MSSEQNELRCPTTPAKMFAKVRAHHKDVTIDPEHNTIEIACKWCRSRLRNEGQDVVLVLHEYNLLGEHIGTTVR